MTFADAGKEWLMEIRTLSVGMLGTQCYLLRAEDGAKGCVVIDPGAEPERILKAAGEVEAILLTHGHFDHIGAVRQILEAFPQAQLLIHPLDAPMLGDPGLNAGMGLLNRSITAPEPTGFVREGESFSIAGIPFSVLHTPGHTPGSVCFRTGEDLFTGDTLFEHGWGRTDLPGGNNAEMMRSLRRLLPLAKKYRVHPGHEG